MKERQDTIDLRLSPELPRACVIGVVGFLVSGGVVEGVSIYLRELEGQTHRPLNPFPAVVAAFLASLIYMLGRTWRAQILPLGVEVRYLLISRIWTWEDFQQAEAGNYQVYFPHLSLWKRYLNIGFSDGEAREKAWKQILAHIPPPEEWKGSLTIWSENWAKLTFSDGGISVRRFFREQLLSWNELERAVVFRSASSLGFRNLKLVFPGRVFRWDRQFRTLRGRSNNPADYDVVNVLAAHLPKEKLVFCTPEMPASNLEEVEERRKASSRAKWYGLAYGLGMAALILFYCCRCLYYLLADWRLVSGYWAAVVVVLAVMLLAAGLFGAVALLFWRESREQEEQLDKDSQSLTSGRQSENVEKE